MGAAWVPLLVYAGIFLAVFLTLPDDGRCPTCGRGEKDET